MWQPITLPITLPVRMTIVEIAKSIAQLPSLSLVLCYAYLEHMQKSWWQEFGEEGSLCKKESSLHKLPAAHMTFCGHFISLVDSFLSTLIAAGKANCFFFLKNPHIWTHVKQGRENKGCHAWGQTPIPWPLVLTHLQCPWCPHHKCSGPATSRHVTAKLMEQMVPFRECQGPQLSFVLSKRSPSKKFKIGILLVVFSGMVTMRVWLWG